MGECTCNCGCNHNNSIGDRFPRRPVNNFQPMGRPSMGWSINSESNRQSPPMGRQPLSRPPMGVGMGRWMNNQSPNINRTWRPIPQGMINRGEGQWNNHSFRNSPKMKSCNSNIAQTTVKSVISSLAIIWLATIWKAFLSKTTKK